MVYTFFVYTTCFMWTVEQNEAINKRNSNVLVSASAGSGKTAVLITRVINRVIEDEIDIDKLLVVTFTNASALELKDRLKKSLDETLAKNKNKKQFIKKQIKLLNRANICTLHAFCLKVIRENFELLEISPDFKIADENESLNLKIKALDLVFEEEYKTSNDKLIKILKLFNYKEEELFNEILNIYSYIKCLEKPFEFLNESLEKYNFARVKDICELDYGRNIYQDVISRLKILCAKINEKIEMLNMYDDFTKIRDTLIEDEYKINNIIASSDNSWDKLYDSLHSIKFNNFSKYTGNNFELKEEISNFRKSVVKAEFTKCQKNICEKTEVILNDNLSAYEYLQYIYTILQRFEKTYSDLKLEKNLIDFADIEHMTYELILSNGELTEVGLNLREKFEEVYTDEYQDISAIQEAILKVLSKDNNRFMVGDVKQSIYHFRGASPEIFNKKIDTYNFIKDLKNDEEDTKIILAQNFRSRKEVINSVNFIFERIMSKSAGGCDYSLYEKLKYSASFKEDEDSKYISEVNVINLKKDESYLEKKYEEEDKEESLIEELKDFEVEAIQIADKINTILSSYNVSTKDGIRKAKYSDIVILLRNVAGKAKILEETFKKKGIPCFSDVSSSIFEREEVDLLLSFLRVLDNKYQDVYLIAIMYSVIGNFTLDELAIIKNNKKSTYFYSLLEEYVLNGKDEKLVKKVQVFLDKLNYYGEFSKKRTISELILEIYHNTGLYYQFIFDKNVKERKANLDLILNMTLEFEKNNLANLNEYISYVDSLKNKLDSSSMSAKTLGENEDVVKIMTIHKSKGLEFPIVILSDTARKYNYKELNNKILLDSQLGVGINIVNEEYNVSYPSIIKQAIKYKMINEIKSEELRLLYVAMTRAKEKLIIFGTTKDYSKLNDSLFVMKKGNLIDSYVVLQNDSYLKNILLALKSDNYLDTFSFNLLNGEVKDTNSFEVISSKESILEEIELKEKEIDEKVLNEKIKDIDDEVNSYIKNVDFKNTSRVSVSELKKEDSVVNFETPNCISKKTYMSSARKGTLIHFILQILDFNTIDKKDDLIYFISECEKNNIISTEDKKSINVNSIMNFLNSKLGIMIKNSNYIRKEQEFILKNSSFSDSIIQGVVDLYFEDKDGNLILLDFKTDNLDEEKEFITRYKKQLAIYKEALEKLLNKKVYKTYIYSFKLNKEIELGDKDLYEV